MMAGETQVDNTKALFCGRHDCALLDILQKLIPRRISFLSYLLALRFSHAADTFNSSSERFESRTRSRGKITSQKDRKRRSRCIRFGHVLRKRERNDPCRNTTNVKLNSSVKVRVPEADLSRRLTAVRCFRGNFVRDLEFDGNSQAKYHYLVIVLYVVCVICVC